MKIWMEGRRVTRNYVYSPFMTFQLDLRFLYKYHPGLTRVSSIRFLLFEIKRVLVYNSTTFYLTDLFNLYFFIQNAYGEKKAFWNIYKTVKFTWYTQDFIIQTFWAYKFDIGWSIIWIFIFRYVYIFNL